MKKHVYTIIAMIVLGGSMAVVANAQTSGSTRLTANVPFEFNAGGQTLPAGEYTIVQVNPASDRAVMQLRTKDGRQTAMIQMGPVIGKAENSSRLIFHRYGDQYYFAEAWIEGETSGLQAPKPRAERRLAGHKMAIEQVALGSMK